MGDKLHHMEKRNFDILLEGWLAQTLTAKEIDEFLELVNEPEFQTIIEERLGSDLDTATFSGLSSLEDRDRLREQLLEKINAKKNPVKTFTLDARYWAAAAIFILIAGAAFLFYRMTSSCKNDTQNNADLSNKSIRQAMLILANGDSATLESLANNNANFASISSAGISYKENSNAVAETHSIYVPAGAKPVEVVLSDRTTVKVNTASTFTYKTNFTGEKRETTLVGEAYFDVAKNKEKPFFVHADKMDIRVLGTAFNIKSYPGEQTAQTSLFRGSVEVTTKKQPDKKIILKPNEILEITEAVNAKNNQSTPANKEAIKISLTTSAKPEANDISDEILWTKNKLAFDYLEFKHVVPMIERWYGVKIQIENKSLLNKRFSGVFEGRPIEEVLKALQLVGKFDYQRKGDLIIIK